MSTYGGRTEEFERKHHYGYLPIAVALMLICSLVTIFVVNPQAGGYGGGNNPLSMWEAAGLFLGGGLLGYIPLGFQGKENYRVIENSRKLTLNILDKNYI